MSLALWVAQGWLAALMFVAGAVKLAVPKRSLEGRGMEYLTDLSSRQMTVGRIALAP